jgi:hypothetical protein
LVVLLKIQVFLDVVFVVGHAVTDVLKECSAFIFWVKQSKKNGNLGQQQ